MLIIVSPILPAPITPTNKSCKLLVVEKVDSPVFERAGSSLTNASICDKEYSATAYVFAPGVLPIAIFLSTAALQPGRNACQSAAVTAMALSLGAEEIAFSEGCSTPPEYSHQYL